MRFAIKSSQMCARWSDPLALWKEADDIDIFESGWIFDHLYPTFGDLTAPCLESWTTLAALAQATRRIRLGILVSGVHFRHPAVLAKMTSTVDIISGGRVELGVGAGWNLQECEAYGIELGTPRERSDRLAEACQVLTSLLTQETTTFHGRYYRLTNARNEPKGPQRPHPPIVIGGDGERRTLRTVAAFAQHWNFHGKGPEVLTRKLDILRSYCAELDRDPRDILVSGNFWLDSAQHIGQVVDEVAAMEAAGMQLAVIYIAGEAGQPSLLSPLADALSPLRDSVSDS